MKIHGMYNKDFANRVAVISGGADGLGKAIASRLAFGGARLALIDYDSKKLQTTIAEFSEKGYDVKGWELDISCEKKVIQTFEEIMVAYGKMDIMVNSAGIVGPTSTSILNYEVEDFDRVYEVNLRGSFLMAKYALLRMEPRGYGRILLIASIAGKEGNPFMAGYSATKAGVIGLVKSLGKEFATKGISINGIAPAVIKTAMNADTTPEQLAYMVNKIPMGRLGTVEEVADLSAFIVSEENSFSTGFIFDLSGGRANY